MIKTMYFDYIEINDIKLIDNFLDNFIYTFPTLANIQIFHSKLPHGTYL